MNMMPIQGFTHPTNRGSGSNERMQDMMRNKQKRKKRRNTYHKPDRGGNKVIVEPFDIQPPKEFKEINNTRKVHYPMMLQKYNCEKVMPWNLDDFRYAMLMIVRTDNDEVFNEHLAKKSGRAGAVKKKNEENERLKTFVNTVQLDPDAPVDRTSPQKVAARGFYTGSLFSNQSNSKQDVSRYQSEQGYTMRTNPQAI